MKLVDIAHKLSLPEGTVRRWKSTYKWDGERSDKKSERSGKKKTAKKEQIDDGTKETLENDDLSPEQQLFCIYYSKTFNATQSYLKAYKCNYAAAHASGSRLLTKVSIQEEIKRLKEIKRQQILAGEEDIVELQMRIAFSDIGDYLTFGREAVPVMSMYGPVKVKDEITGKKKILTENINVVRLNESDMVDTQLIQEVKQGRDGVSVKLADKQKAMEWLTKFFELNPADKHKREFDMRKMELELLKLEMQQKDTQTGEPVQDNFLDVLNQVAGEVWNQEQLDGN